MEKRKVSLTSSSSLHKVKRGERKSKAKFSQESMNILGSNAAGVLNKIESLKRNIQIFTPGVNFLQETKAKIKDQIKLDDYVVFEYLRKDKGGGGLLTAVQKNLHPVSVSEDTDTEILVVQGDINNEKIRFINAYGPQENNDEDIKVKFFSKLD